MIQAIQQDWYEYRLPYDRNVPEAEVNPGFLNVGYPDSCRSDFTTQGRLGALCCRKALNSDRPLTTQLGLLYTCMKHTISFAVYSLLGAIT